MEIMGKKSANLRFQKRCQFYISYNAKSALKRYKEWVITLQILSLNKTIKNTFFIHQY